MNLCEFLLDKLKDSFDNIKRIFYNMWREEGRP